MRVSNATEIRVGPDGIEIRGNAYLQTHKKGNSRLENANVDHQHWQLHTLRC